MNKLILLFSLLIIIISSNVNIFADHSYWKITGKTDKFQIFDKPPAIIKRIQPKYHEFAKKAGIKGVVKLMVEVFIDGTVGAIEVKKSLMAGPGGLDYEAIQAVRQWEFSPATCGGNPVAVWIALDVDFLINNKQPVLIKRVHPKYPEYAKTAKIEGIISVEIEVLIDGSVGNVNVKHRQLSDTDGALSSTKAWRLNRVNSDNFATAAINAVKQWKFSPAENNGRPIAVWVEFYIKFELDNIIQE
ncbi:MAG: energy transducer TonB [Candidatus Cloacimonadota bacterium]|nr:energy transducer TonB [Candidatus Cloacimonadota bacterium]